MDLSGQAALVTGGGKGIGEATAKLLAESGAAVMVADWDEAAAAESAQAIEATGGKAASIKCDVSNRDQAHAAVEATVKAFGQIDILINNAGITRDATLLKMEPHQWDQVIAVNLTGVYNCSQAAGQHMRERQYGRIVNASSISGFGNFGQSNYAATKAGLVGLTRTMAIELARYKVTVNAIAPGFIKTDMTAAMPPDFQEAMIQSIPMKRAGAPLDIARVYRFLVDPASDFITGQLFVIDGGATLPH